MDQSQPSGAPSDRETAYEDRVLAWLDILGWSDLVDGAGSDNSKFGQIFRAAGLLRSPKDRQNAQLARSDDYRAQGLEIAVDLLPEITHFSDTVIWSCKAADDAIYQLVDEVQETCCLLLAHGHLSRGAIVYGPLHHQGGTIFGPALMSAYRLEGQVAHYPRVLIDDSVKPWIPRSYSFEGEAFNTLDSRVDADGLTYLDIFGGIRSKVGNSPRRSTWNETVLLDRVEKQFETLTSPRQRAKWGWTLSYLRDIVNEIGT